MLKREAGRKAAQEALRDGLQLAARIKLIKKYLLPGNDRTELRQLSRKLKAAYSMFLNNVGFYFSFPISPADLEASVSQDLFSPTLEGLFGASSILIQEVSSATPRPTDPTLPFLPVLHQHILANDQLFNTQVKVKVICSRDEADLSICLFAAALVHLQLKSADALCVWSTDSDFLYYRFSDVFRFLVSPIPRRHQTSGDLRVTDKRVLEVLPEWPESLSQALQEGLIIGCDFTSGKGIRHLGLGNMQIRLACLVEVSALIRPALR